MNSFYASQSDATFQAPGGMGANVNTWNPDAPPGFVGVPMSVYAPSTGPASMLPTGPIQMLPGGFMNRRPWALILFAGLAILTFVVVIGMFRAPSTMTTIPAASSNINSFPMASMVGPIFPSIVTGSNVPVTTATTSNNNNIPVIFTLSGTSTGVTAASTSTGVLMTTTGVAPPVPTLSTTSTASTPVGTNTIGTPVDGTLVTGTTTSVVITSTTTRFPTLPVNGNGAVGTGTRSTTTGTGTRVATSTTIPRPPITTPTMPDFIIVGAGTAGAVLAKRLSDTGQFQVLVLEAGAFRDCDAPIRQSENAFALQAQYEQEYFWPGGQSVPQPQLNNRTLDYTGGRLPGGSSSINGQQYVRATPDVLHEWFQLTGGMDDDWSVDRTLNVYREFEQYQGHTTNRIARGLHGDVHVRMAPQSITPMAQQITRAISRATGVPEIVDYNDPSTPLGAFSRWQVTQYPDGQRESSSTAYLRPYVRMGTNGTANQATGIRGRPLHVWTNMQVTRVVMEGTRASGVEYQISGSGPLQQLRARRGVIVCAGIHSPSLLLKSGIGPAADLQNAGIPLVIDNPNVGQNLSNHTLLTMTSSLSAPPNLVNADPNALYISGAFLPNPVPGSGAGRGLELVVTQAFAPQGAMTWIVMPLQPLSRGSVRLAPASSQPASGAGAPGARAETQVDFGYLTNRRDIDSLMAMVRQVRDCISTLGEQLINPPLAVVNDDAALEAHIRGTLAHNHHFVGTCKMATRDQGGVVDSWGRVYGATQLWVADDSVMPIPNTGNTSAPAYLIGHVIAEKLLRDLNPQGIVPVENQDPCLPFTS